VFFGGGTPSLLPLAEMRRLIEGLRERFDWSGVEEFTVEVNPATAREDYCRMLREAGVDRLSFGAQSFDRAELKTLERHHEPGDVAHSVEAARAAGFERLNLDLIYAIPGQDLASWDRSLAAALALGTTHLSCYGLTYEPNTPMAVKKRLGQLVGAEEELELAMFRHTSRTFAQKGLVAYEISNYAVPGQECRHNLIYWSGGNYIGLGPSAASHVEGWRWRNRPHLGEWEEAVDAGGLPAVDVERLTHRRRAGELAMLMLRLARGIDPAAISARTGVDARNIFAGHFDRLIRLGLLEAHGDSIRLSDNGLAVADAVAAEFLADND
jgi:oxygen-independent coproporphyrinogen-3 oxidase